MQSIIQAFVIGLILGICIEAKLRSDEIKTIKEKHKIELQAKDTIINELRLQNKVPYIDKRA